MAGFTITTQPLTASSAMCRVAGELDAQGFEALEEEFGKLTAAGVSALVLELSGLETITSAALGAIVNMNGVLAKREGRLVLTLLRPGIEGLLEMLNLKDSLTIAGSPEEARSLIAGAR